MELPATTDYYEPHLAPAHLGEIVRKVSRTNKARELFIAPLQEKLKGYPHISG